jgi:uncharacterized membrane protein YbhN (UPF0104 family)
LKKKNWILGLIVLVALVALFLIARHRIHFNWSVFVEQIKLADWKKIGIAVSMIWLAYIIRALRWALFLKPTKKVSPFRILGTQVIGFTGVALLGRPADLVRPYLVAKRVQLPLSSQVAVYVVERMFDAGAMALIFSTVLLFAPDRHSLPHPEAMNKAALIGLLATVALALFAGLARISGGAFAAMTRKSLGAISPKLGESVSEKILHFRDGLNTISSMGDFLLAAFFSLAMWGMITFAYLETTRAFTASPELSGMTLSRCMLLMVVSMGGSAFQLPIIGWFTQIGLLTAALQGFYHVAPEPALGCGAMLLSVTFLSIIPVGLIWSRFEHVSLKKVAEESEHAGETLAAHAPAPSAQEL